ncbi:MAG: peptidase [Clostridia bacterium]|jgi:RsiW-degrading membrane proteinase PrsW (M82 family)|nr:peptidase [Clostridia bacterium]
MLLLISAIAPSMALLYYIYLRDKYEREPRRLLTKAFLSGSIAVVPIVLVELRLNLFDLETDSLLTAGYTAFIVAGLVEEGFKFLIFWLFIWRNRNFNESYDGIVYSAFISLGFATTENIGYVMLSGYHAAFIRALTAVPAHALFGVVMGYYFGVAKFKEDNMGKRYILYALMIPILLHGIYDFILFSKSPVLLMAFIPYMLYLWRRGLIYVDRLSDQPAHSFRNYKNKR